jgi:hypothetical protein
MSHLEKIFGVYNEIRLSLEELKRLGEIANIALNLIFVQM